MEVGDCDLARHGSGMVSIRYQTIRPIYIPPIGALGALLASPTAFGEQGNQSLVWIGIAVSSALSTLLVTLIVRSWRDAMFPELPA
jgi:hypothetical protein